MAKLQFLLAALISVGYILGNPGFAETKNEQPEGTLIAIGGGALPDRILDRFVALAGGAEASFLVIWQASEKPGAGERGKALLEKRGVKRVATLDLEDGESALKAVNQSDGIWISGGSQGLLMKRLRKVDGLVEAIRKQHHSGAIVAGTSAGAAVMSDIMIAGDDIPLDRGLALWPEVIVDQHFVARKRMQRSFDAVLKNPGLVGIGIGEATGVIVRARRFKVIGERTVTVIDARDASQSSKDKGVSSSWRNVRIHSLREGETWQP